MEQKGYVITSNVTSIPKLDCDEIWLITRSQKNIPGTIHVQTLAPSPRLYKKFYLVWRKQDPKLWWPIYKKEFNKELESKEKRLALRKLWSLVNQGKVIALVCYCKKRDYCHRSLIGDLLMKKNVLVREYSHKETQKDIVQLKLFEG